MPTRIEPPEKYFASWTELVANDNAVFLSVCRSTTQTLPPAPPLAPDMLAWYDLQRTPPMPPRPAPPRLSPPLFTEGCLRLGRNLVGADAEIIVFRKNGQCYGVLSLS